MHMTWDEYRGLWNSAFAPHCGGLEIPSYTDYLQRECMLDDYLDIFRGQSSRNTRLAMPYDHPFFEPDGSPKIENPPCIRYILIGEAPPVRHKPKLVHGCTRSDGDSANSYFYDIRHLKQTNWLSSPSLNWGCPHYKPCPENKIKCLACLATKGVLLLDLYPYAIHFSTSLRKRLNSAGTTSMFWDNGVNPYNLGARINSIGNMLCKNWDLSFVAPYVTAEFIINPINLIQPLKTIPAGLHSSSLRKTYLNKTRMQQSDWQKIAICGGGSPSQDLIRISFI